MNEQQCRRELAAVYRLINHYGWDDLIYTHVSAKITGTDHFLINQFGLTFDEICAGNLVKVDLEGNIIGSGSINPAGFLIHSAIHRVRPDLGCVIHTHTASGVAVSIDVDGLWPVSQTALTIVNDLAYHDYHGLAIDPMEKILLQKNLGNKNFMLLRNHGLLAAGPSIGQAFLNMRRFQNACDIQVLCQKDRAHAIRDDVVESNKPKVKMLDRHWKIAWAALLRIADRQCPGYDN